MLLAIDVGNTNTVIGLFRDKELVKSWRLTTVAQQTADEYGILFRNLFEPSGFRAGEVNRAIISCVVPPLEETLRAMCRDYFGVGALVVGPGIKTGIKLQVDHPQEVGADRIVNAIASWKLYGGPAIVVDFGTATTFDPISKDGAFLGGAIAPGINISAKALYMAAAKLPRVEVQKPRKVIGKNTVDNIQSGLYYGYKGLVDGILEAMVGEMQGDPVIVATGGLGSIFYRESRWIKYYNPNLTLSGLQLLADKNT
ncbi:MAG: type III pantothenate kinase [Acidobacteriota bacterium]|nr:type III pantothenate kinase [Acidobacteriota bacterium]